MQLHVTVLKTNTNITLGVSSLDKHIAWTATIGEQLPELRISYNEFDSAIAQRVKTSLHTHGFALLTSESSALSNEHAARDLQTISTMLGTLLPQSPRKELIEDIRDFSDVDEKDERGYRSGGPLSIHSDPPTLIA